jgi:hypothetical protein
MPYTARPTTTGNQDALAFPKDFSQAHPEVFRSRSDVHVIAPGSFLITTRQDTEPEGTEDDPLLGAFLGFLETQIASRPDLATALTEEDVAGLDDLLEGVPSGDEVDWDEFELP